jgi:CHAT domain-containing protein/Tfp pilus assembly protein PilF
MTTKLEIVVNIICGKKFRIGSAWLLLSAPALIPVGRAQAPSTNVVRQGGRLELKQPIERELGSAQTDVFTVDLLVGQFLHVAFERQSTEAVMLLVGPDGKTLFTADSGTTGTGLQPASLIADRSGRYEVRVSSRTSGPGHYRIELTDLRVPTEQDRTRIRAETEFYAAVENSRVEDKQKWLTAIEQYQRAATLWHSLHGDREEALCLHRIGYIYKFIDEYQQSVGFFNRALPLWRSAGDQAGEAATLNTMANSYKTLGEVQRALDLYDQALALWRAVGDRANESKVLMNIGFAYSGLGDRRKALDYYAQALPIARAAGDRVTEAMTLHNTGMVHWELGESQKALDDYDQALAAWRALGRKIGEADTLFNVTAVYLDLGQRQRALEILNQVLAIFREIGSRTSEVLSLLQLAAVHSEMDDTRKALDDLSQALPLTRASGDRAAEAEVLNGIGEAYLARGQWRRAEEHLRQALAVERAIRDRGGEAAALNDLGKASAGLGHQQQALRQYTQALQLAREVSSPSTQAKVLGNLMGYWQARHNFGLAIFFGKQTVNVYQDLRRNIQGLDTEMQRTYLDTVRKNYRNVADMLISHGRLAEAEQVLGLLKEQEYFNYIRRDSAEASSLNGRANLNPNEAEFERAYREISDTLVAIGTERGALLEKKNRTSEETRRLAELEKDIAIGNQHLESFFGGLAQSFSAKPAVAMHVEQLRETQGIMEDLRELPGGTVAIYTLVGEDKFRAILRTPDVAKAYEFPIKAADLNRKVFEFRQEVGHPERDPRPAAQELYRMLVEPMAKDLRQARARTLMWSLDGTLRYLPLAALYDGRQYLIEQYQVSVMTLASQARFKDRPDRVWRAAGFGVTKAHEDVEALPEVASEMEGVGRILHGEIKLDEAFTETSMRQTLLKRYPVVHIASHFRFQPGNEMQSYLLLGDGGHLSLAELKTSANLFGGVQLLTLSACNTGIGDGTEVEGFGTLAQRQGAKAVIATLWPVADTSTSRLMQEFYRIRETSHGITKLEALREAQLKLLRGEVRADSAELRGRGVRVDAGHAEGPRYKVNPDAPYAHPFYWAPFFLMGNWL